MLSSALVVREDPDIGSVVVGDIHKKSKYAQLRFFDATEFLGSLRRTQLSLLYTSMGLQNPTDDIADDVATARTLFGEFSMSVKGVDCKVQEGL